MLYFAYGSNMDKEDFEKRCKTKGWRLVNFKNPRCAKLNGYKLTFNYYSESRGGGAANIMKNEKSCVYGLFSEIENDDLETIRKKEGYSKDCSKCYYDEICVNVEVDRTVVPYVKTYKVSKCCEIKEERPPTKDYLNLIIDNAKKHYFPDGYIQYLNSVPTKE